MNSLVVFMLAIAAYALFMAGGYSLLSNRPRRAVWLMAIGATLGLVSIAGAVLS